MIQPINKNLNTNRNLNNLRSMNNARVVHKNSKILKVLVVGIFFVVNVLLNLTNAQYAIKNSQESWIMLKNNYKRKDLSINKWKLIFRKKQEIKNWREKDGRIKIHNLCLKDND